jgi:hypothetical protein
MKQRAGSFTEELPFAKRKTTHLNRPLTNQTKTKPTNILVKKSSSMSPEQKAFTLLLKRSSYIACIITYVYFPIFHSNLRSYVYALCSPGVMLGLTIIISFVYRTTTLILTTSLPKTAGGGTVTNLSTIQTQAKDNLVNFSELLQQQYRYVEDVSIETSEKVLIDQFRKRIVDNKPKFDELQALYGPQYDRLLRAWCSCNESQVRFSEDNDEYERVFDKHVNSDFRLVRYLRGRDFNSDKAEIFLRESLYCLTIFRLESHLDTFNVAGKHYMFSSLYLQHGHSSQDRIAKWWVLDREGRLSMFYRTGSCDIKAWDEVVRKKDPLGFVKTAVWLCCLFRRDSDYLHEASSGNVPATVSIVFDIQGFSISKLPPLPYLLRTSRDAITLLSVGFPELSAKIIVVNAPTAFSGIFNNVIRPFLTKKLKENIAIHSRCDFKRHLQPYFLEEFVPKYLGGKLVNEGNPLDSFCTDRLIPFGALVEDEREKAKLLAME